MRLRLFVFTLLLSLLMPGFVRAQKDGPNDRRKEEIAKLKREPHEPRTPPDAKSRSRDSLNQLRLKLHTTKLRINALRNYLSSAGESLKAEEIRAVEASIISLEKEARELERAISEESPSEIPDREEAVTSSVSATTSPSAEVLTSSINVSDRVGALSSFNSSSLPQDTNCYTDVPKRIDQLAGAAAANIVRRKDDAAGVAGVVSAFLPNAIFFTVTDAVTSNSDELKDSALSAYVYIGQTTRTDKQVGTTAASGGSTSAAEKPGWADILGFAIEHGAIQQEVSDTTLTLTTTPYAFIVPSAGDTASARREYGYLRRLGLAASFNISNKDSVLTNATRKDLSQYSAKLGLTSPRGPNSKEFDDRWNNDIKPAIQDYLNALSGGIETLFGGTISTRTQELRTRMTGTVSKSVNDYLATAKTNNVSDDNQKTAVKNILLCALKNEVFDQIKSGGIIIDKSIRDHIVGTVLPNLIAAQKRVKEANNLYQQMLKDFERRPEASVSFVHNRPTTGSEYSTISFLYQQYLPNSPIKLTFNAGPSFYNRPDRTMNQEKFRDFITTLSLEGRRDSPFITTDVDQSQMTYSLTARYQRLQENRGVANKKADIAVVQFKLEIPLSKGFSIPLSLTYANATEQIKEQRVRGNFGFTFDMDRFLGVTKVLDLMKK